MTLTEHSAQPQPAPAISDAVRDLLGAWPHEALLFDPNSAMLLAANHAGRVLFPLLPVTLDGAMPAVRTLREMARTGGDEAKGLPLLFWTTTGLQSLACDVTRCAGPEAEILLLVRAHVPRNHIPATLHKQDTPAPHSDDDALRDIAAKIRDGHKDLASASPAIEVPSAAPPPLSSVEPSSLPSAPASIDLAKLAHELKTPVSAIAAASEIMKEGRFGPIENERYAGYIDGIHASARHALDLIERMLDRRSDTASPRLPTLQFESVDLDPFVVACVQNLQPLASAKGVSMSSRPGAPHTTVKADRTALKQIILNLLTNAIKFTPSGGTITVATTRGSRGAAAITVEDSGPGMTAVAIAEALRPVPIDVPGHIRDGGGLGLGLPLSRALAEANGATLSIDSAPGRGTRVTLTFPGGLLVAI